MSSLTKDDVDAIKEKFELKNGSLAQFNNKELILFVHKDIKDECADMKRDIGVIFKKIDNHECWGHKMEKETVGKITTNQLAIQKLLDKLPEKGFCEKVENALWPKNDMPLPQKVENMWYGWRTMKWLIGTGAGAIIVGVITTIISLIRGF